MSDMSFRRHLMLFAALLLPFAVACEPTPVSTVTPSWPPPALAPVPAAGTRSVQIFVVGDSWAQQAGNGTGVLGHVLTPPPLGSWHFVAGTDSVRAAFAGALDDAGQHRFAVSEVQSWGIGGSTSSNWASGHPCDPYVYLDADGETGNEFVADMYTLGCMLMQKTKPTPDLVTPLLAEITASPQQPVVYLSLGGNDIVFELSQILDLRRSAGTLPREVALQRAESNIETLIQRILAARPDADIVLSGYARVNANMPYDGKTALEKFWRPLFPFTPNVTANEVDTILNGSMATTDLSSSKAGLRTVYARLAAAHPGQVFAPNASNFGSLTAFIADAAHLQDPIHLKSSTDAYLRFAQGVVSLYRP